jgi:hypothetical protein
MWNKKPTQCPDFAATRRRDKDDGARCITQDGYGHAAECTRLQVGPNLGTHDNHGRVSFSGFVDDDGCGRSGATLDYEPARVFA